MSLPTFIFIAIFYSILGSLLGFGVGHIVGYLKGKAEVSNIVRGEPPDDMDNEIEHFKAFRADTAERQGGPISR
ncbi:MAG: hypothetical protein ABS917_11320 [Solibacillus sp.]|uniref:hypothetical protein n=1 Tax=Solibacillus sp. TaxID=1909654 RepID=UPI0033148598